MLKHPAGFHLPTGGWIHLDGDAGPAFGRALLDGHISLELQREQIKTAPELAFLLAPPNGLQHLKTAEFLRSIYHHHREDPDDGEFRDLMMAGLKSLGLPPRTLSFPLGSHSNPIRAQLDYLSLKFKNFHLLVLEGVCHNWDYIEREVAQKGASLITIGPSLDGRQPSQHLQLEFASESSRV